MDLEMVLNELSMRSPADDMYAARQRMIQLIETIISATKYGVKRTLRTHSDFDTYMLAPDYPIIRWRNDPAVDRELRRFFKTLVTKAPFLEDIVDASVQDSFFLSEFFHSEDSAVGLGVAYLLEALAISLASEKRWDNPFMQLKLIQISDDDTVLEVPMTIPHASIKTHLETHSAWITNRLRKTNEQSYHDGTTLWQDKEFLFPHLYFCGSVETNLHNLSQGNSLLVPVVNRLYELETFCRNWMYGPFDSDKIPSKATNESEATMQKFSQERTFLCHDGISRTFRWHVRLTPSAWRLYFYPLYQERKLIIGYIGPHLPTDKFH